MATGQDTLLAFVYFLSRWITTGTVSEQVFRKYSQNFFSQMTSFFFDAPFRAAIAGDQMSHDKAREFFKRTATQDISKPYTDARHALGLL
jgi:hypothetical protein